MRTVKLSLAMAGAALLLLVASPALAHVMLMPGDVAPGATLDTELLVVHGCGPGGTIPATDDDASPTVSLSLEVPDPIGVTPHDVEGWTVTTDRNDSGTEVLWEHDDPAGTLDPIYLDLTLDAEAFDDDAEFWFPAIQDCADGERMSWTLPGMQERDGQLAGVGFGVTTPPEEPSQGLSPVMIAVIAVLLAGAAGGASFLFTGRGANSSR